MFGIATINAVPEEIAANAEVWREKPWSEGGPCQNWKIVYFDATVGRDGRTIKARKGRGVVVNASCNGVLSMVKFDLVRDAATLEASRVSLAERGYTRGAF
jgi:hypothetical protein